MTRQRALEIIVAMLLVGFCVLAAITVSNYSAVQSQRYNILLSNCQDSTAKHDATVNRLRKLTNTAEALHPKQTAALEASLASTLTIIDTLAPRSSNCQKTATTKVNK